MLSTKSLHIIVAFVLLCSQVVAATKDSPDRISPFSLEADSYAASVRSVFLHLPLITDPETIKTKTNATETTVKTELNKLLTGGFRYGMYKNVQMIGAVKIETRGPVKLYNKETYLWIAEGRVQYFYYTNNKRVEKAFFFVGHFNTVYTTGWQNDWLLFGDEKMRSDDTLLKEAALVSDPLRRVKMEKMHKEALEKEEWFFNNRTVHGKLTGYRHGKVSIEGNSKRFPSLDVMKFSLDDQELIRAYIDYEGIPVRDPSYKPEKR